MQLHYFRRCIKTACAHYSFVALASFALLVVGSITLCVTLRTQPSAPTCDQRAPASFTVIFFAGLNAGCGLLLTATMATRAIRTNMESSSALAAFASSTFHFLFIALRAAPVVCVSAVGGGWSASEVRPQVPQEYLFWATATVAMLMALGRMVRVPVSTQRSMRLFTAILVGSGCVATFAASLALWAAALAVSLAFHAIVTVQIWALFNAARARSQDDVTRGLLAWIHPLSIVVWNCFPLLWVLGQFSVLTPTAEFLLWPIVDFLFKGAIALLLVVGCFHHNAQAARAVLDRAEARSVQAQMSKEETSRSFLRWTLHELRVPVQGASLAMKEIQDGLEAVLEEGAAAAKPLVAIPEEEEGLLRVAGFAEAASQADPLMGTIARLHKTSKVVSGDISAVAKLLDNFLSLAKIADGRMELEPADVPVRPWINDVTAAFTATLRANGLLLRVSVAEDVPAVVRIDGNRLRQVVTNYLSNAVKFSPASAGAEVVLKLDRVWRPAARVLSAHARAATVDQVTRAELTLADARVTRPVQGRGGGGGGGLTPTPSFFVQGRGGGGGGGGGNVPFLHFSCVDAGPGIAPRDIPELFKPYSSQARAGGGDTGLGLALCKKIIELSGGLVGVESTVGKGSCFWFEVPLELPAPADSLFWSGYRAAATSGWPVVGSVSDDGKPAVVCDSDGGGGAASPQQQHIVLPLQRSASSAAPPAPAAAQGPAEVPCRSSLPLRSLPPPLSPAEATSRRALLLLGLNKSSVRSSAREEPSTSAGSTVGASRCGSAASHVSVEVAAAAAAEGAPALPGQVNEEVSSPALDGAGTGLSTAAPAAAGASRLRLARRVVVVVNASSNRDIFARQLQRNGCEVVFAAEHGQDCLDKAVALASNGAGTALDSLVDAWFVDGDMPVTVMGGLELTRLLRALGVRAAIVAITGNALGADRDMFIAAGASAVLAKPVMGKDLAAAGLRLPGSTAT